MFTLTLGLCAFPACCAETPLEQTVARLATRLATLELENAALKLKEPLLSMQPQHGYLKAMRRAEYPGRGCCKQCTTRRSSTGPR